MEQSMQQRGNSVYIILPQLPTTSYGRGRFKILVNPAVSAYSIIVVKEQVYFHRSQFFKAPATIFHTCSIKFTSILNIRCCKNLSHELGIQFVLYWYCATLYYSCIFSYFHQWNITISMV